jgi:hypothetical protein
VSTVGLRLECELKLWVMAWTAAMCRVMPHSVLESHAGLNQLGITPNLQSTSRQRAYIAREITKVRILPWHLIARRFAGVPKDECLIPTGPGQSAAPSTA